MKRILSIIISLILITGIALAYTTTIKANGIGLIVTTTPGSTVTITPKTSEITGWEVEEGTTTVVNNEFVMPEENVVINAKTGTDPNPPVEPTTVPWTITTITDEGATVEGTNYNHKCSVCGGKDHECEIINITIEADHAEVTEQ